MNKDFYFDESGNVELTYYLDETGTSIQKLIDWLEQAKKNFNPNAQNANVHLDTRTNKLNVLVQKSR